MEIVRNGVSIQLTPEEMRLAYDKYLHECLVADAKNNFKEWLERVDYDTEDDERFDKRYGFSIAAAYNPLGSHYMIEKFVEAFQKKYDTNVAERTLWVSAITDVMDALPRPMGVAQTYRVTYKEELYYHYDVEAHSQAEAEEIWHNENKSGNPDFQVVDPGHIEFSGVCDVHLKRAEEE